MEDKHQSDSRNELLSTRDDEARCRMFFDVEPGDLWPVSLRFVALSAGTTLKFPVARLYTLMHCVTAGHRRALKIR